MMSVTAIIQGAQAQHSWNRGRESHVGIICARAFAWDFLAPLVYSESLNNWRV